MFLLDRRALPNLITVGRMLLTPIIFFLILAPSPGARGLAFILFVIAAVSDLWDGYLARKHGWISDFGKLMDPIADKLLLVVTFVPIYMVSHGSGPVGALPYWKVLPLWVLIVTFGRELLITLMRGIAAKRGIIVPAGKAGKYKAFVQNIFSGATILWYALQSAAWQEGWSGALWSAWQVFHGIVLALALLGAVFLTLFSLAVYLWNWRAMMRDAR